MTAVATAIPSNELIGQLGAVCSGHGLHDLATRLEQLQQWISADMRSFDRELALVPRGASVVCKSAHYLVDMGGKHLRPMCVALAAKLGTGFDKPARQLGVAVELIHNATLLHDDVIDLGERRRGAPTARMIYGNAASIFAGDWLLVSALKRVNEAGIPGILEYTLNTIEEMIAAEALQLENRGRINPSRDDYFAVVEGKTAALFRWAMFSGFRAGGLTKDDCDRLERFGAHLGVAFQLVDDLLDFAGDAEVTGKALFADLREGKITYPLLLAMERDLALRPVLEEILAGPENEPIPASLAARVLESLRKTAGDGDTMKLAQERATQAIGCLSALPAGTGRDALVTVAEATVYRQR